MLNDYRRFIAGCFLLIAIAISIQQARAQANVFGQFMSSAPAVGAVAVGTGAVVTAVASGAAAVGGFIVGISPIGWVGIGVVAIGTAYAIYDATSDTKTTAIVHTSPPSVQPNPDLESAGATAPIVSIPAQFQVDKLGTPEPYLYFDISECVQDGLRCHGASNARPSPRWNTFQSRLANYLKTYYDVTIAYAYAIRASSNSAECATETYSNSYSGPAGWCVRIVTASSPGSTAGLFSTNANWYGGNAPGSHATYRTGNGPSIECDASVSYYDYNMSTCVLRTPSHSASLADGYCNISFSEKGNPIVNPFDPDCARMTSIGALALSKGNSSTAPSVTVKDPATGNTLTTSRPAVASQGTVGSVNIRERVVDPVQNTTKDKTLTLNPPAAVGQPPTTAGAGEVLYPGTGAGTGATPIGQVAVSNWPNTMKVTGSVVCENCAQQAPVVNVNTPDTIKIDSEGKSEADLPDALAEAERVKADAGEGLLSSVQNRISGITNFGVPAHTAECPAIQVQWRGYIDMDYKSTAMCEVLENPSIKTVVQGGLMLIYIITGILIILGA